MKLPSVHRTHRLLAFLALAVPAAIAGPARPAVAAAPDRVGLVQYDGVSTVATGTFPAATTVTTPTPGRYTVRFPGAAATGGVVHVTAITMATIWCQADAWAPNGADEVVGVSCYRTGGTLAPSGFTALFESSSTTVVPGPGRFGYVDAAATGALISQYNSAGGLNTVTRKRAGRYLVRLAGLTTPGPMDGDVQAGAVNPTVGARCKIGQWSSSPQASTGQEILVLCFDAAGRAFDTRFSLSYQYQRSLLAGPFRYFDYLWNRPGNDSAATNYDSIIGAGVNSVERIGAFRTLVLLGQYVPPNTIQVTAVGTSSDFCVLYRKWSAFPGNLATDTVVNCFTNAGVGINLGFTASYDSAG